MLDISRLNDRYRHRRLNRLKAVSLNVDVAPVTLVRDRFAVLE
jgi:hypothetical protein